MRGLRQDAMGSSAVFSDLIVEEKPGSAPGFSFPGVIPHQNNAASPIPGFFVSATSFSPIAHTSRRKLSLLLRRFQLGPPACGPFFCSPFTRHCSGAGPGHLIEAASLSEVARSVPTQNQRMRAIPLGEDCLPAMHAKHVVIGMPFLHLQLKPAAGFEINVDHRTDELFTDDGAIQPVASHRLRGQVDMLGTYADRNALSGNNCFPLRQPREDSTML